MTGQHRLTQHQPLFLPQAVHSNRPQTPDSVPMHSSGKYAQWSTEKTRSIIAEKK